MSSFISKQCSYYLTFNHTMEFFHYQALSGLGFNKIGFYQDCIADPNNQFYLAKGSTTVFSSMGEDPKIFMSGICFNSICSASDLKYALGSFYEYMQLPFTLIKVQTPSLIVETFEFENITALTILSILIFLFLVCSIIDLLKKMRKINYNTSFVEIFSVFTTLKLLESRSQRNKERIKGFSGIKALCLVGILMTNIGTLAYQAPTTSIYEQTQNGIIFLSFYAADIWLMVSGFFLSFLLLKQYAKNKSKKILLLKIVRRFLRLWPLYILSLLFNSNVIPLIGQGPLWPLLIEYPKQKNCLGPHHIFMISNFFDTSCYNWLWLFQLDFQLYIIFVPVLLLYLQWQNKANKLFKYLFFGIQLLFILSTILVAFFMKETQYRNITDYFFHQELSRFNINPITRGSGFIIGYNLGIIFQNFKKMPQKQSFWLMKKLRLKFFRIMLPLIGFLGFIGISYFFNSLDGKQLQDSHIFFFSSFHILVPLLISFILIPSLFGYSSPLKRILECWPCNLISKLSLSLYSTNFMTTLFIIYYRQNDLELSPFTIIFLAFCTIIPSTFFAIILTTVIQIPVFVLKKVFSKTERITYFQH